MTSTDLKKITERYFSDFNLNLAKHESENLTLEAHKISLDFSDKSGSHDLSHPPEYSYQTFLRPLFGKQGVNDSKVGPHPDFAYLKDTEDVKLHYIVTMFVDISRSSRLALLLNLEDVYLVKNRILQACVDVVRALDGFPHRLMGDALMAYFGGLSYSKEDAIANALNAASTLKFILSEYVFPSLNQKIERDVDLGVKIGIDFGDDHEVIWANYGYGEASEVTALGIPVDLASKAQRQAKRNTVMLGEGVLNHIDFPDDYSEIKTKVVSNNNSKEERYILPNMIKSDGEKLNRKCRLLKMDNYQKLLPLKVSEKIGLDNHVKGLIANENCEFSCRYRQNESSDWKPYRSVSMFLEKGMMLEFILNVDRQVLVGFGPLKVSFVKTNHGKEARNAAKGDEGTFNAGTYYLNPTSVHIARTAILPEATAYRGLHTMEVQVSPKESPQVILYQDIIGVYIK